MAASVSIHSEQLGSEGEHVLLLHGWKHQIEMMRPLGELLSEFAVVHLIDLPGHGKSEEPDGVWGMEEFARRILLYIEETGLGQVDLVGHSFGGKTSIKLASMFPEKVRRIVLINSSGLKPHRSLGRKLKIFLIGRLRAVVKLLDGVFNLKIFEKWFIPRFASPDYLTAGPIRKTFVKTVNEDLSEEAKKVSAPTLLLWGELDTETPVETGRKMSGLIPNSRLVELKGKGHEMHLGPGAHLCSYHIKPFLTQEDPFSSNMEQSNG